MAAAPTAGAAGSGSASASVQVNVDVDVAKILPEILPYAKDVVQWVLGQIQGHSYVATYHIPLMTQRGVAKGPLNWELGNVDDHASLRCEGFERELNLGQPPIHGQLTINNGPQNAIVLVHDNSGAHRGSFELKVWSPKERTPLIDWQLNTDDGNDAWRRVYIYSFPVH
jgi:hypothetical protein